MKKIIWLLLSLCLFAAMPAQAKATSVWLTVTVPAAPLPDYYAVTGITGVTNVPYATGANMAGTTLVKIANVSLLTVGTPYTVTVSACSNTWGCSAATAPFTFTQVAPPAVPTGLGLSVYSP